MKRVGFEPTVIKLLIDLQSTALSHSATSSYCMNSIHHTYVWWLSK